MHGAQGRWQHDATIAWQRLSMPSLAQYDDAGCKPELVHCAYLPATRMNRAQVEILFSLDC